MEQMFETIYDKAGRRYCKENNFSFIKADPKGCRYRNNDDNKEYIHRWDQKDARVINFAFYGAREM